MGNDHSSPGIKSHGHVNAKTCVLHQYLLRRPMSIDGRNSRDGHETLKPETRPRRDVCRSRDVTETLKYM